MRRAAASAAGGARGVAAAAGEAPGAGRYRGDVRGAQVGVGTVEGDLPAVRVADQSKHFLDTRAGFFAEFVSVAAASRFLRAAGLRMGKFGKGKIRASAQSTRSSKRLREGHAPCAYFRFEPPSSMQNGHDDTVSLGARSPRPVRPSVVAPPSASCFSEQPISSEIETPERRRATRDSPVAVRLGSSRLARAPASSSATLARSRGGPGARRDAHGRRRASSVLRRRVHARSFGRVPRIPTGTKTIRAAVAPICTSARKCPDNHTDDSFLERLVLNGRVVPRRFTRVALDATAVSQQLAVVALKASATASLLSGLSARDALAADTARSPRARSSRFALRRPTALRSRRRSRRPRASAR